MALLNFKRVLHAMADATKDLCERAFYVDRPASVDAPLNSYLVYDIESNFTNKEIDAQGGYDYFSCRVSFSLFVRDRKRASNPSLMDLDVLDQKVSELLKRFPIVDKERKVRFYRPRIILHGTDGSGFHYAFIETLMDTNI